jgi:hypothetical protein
MKKNAWLTSENIQGPARCTENEEVLRHTEAGVLKVRGSNKLLESFAVKSTQGMTRPPSHWGPSACPFRAGVARL